MVRSALWALAAASGAIAAIILPVRQADAVGACAGAGVGIDVGVDVGVDAVPVLRFRLR